MQNSFLKYASQEIVMISLTRPRLSQRRRNNETPGVAVNLYSLAFYSVKHFMQNVYKRQTNRCCKRRNENDGIFEKGLNETFESIHE